MGAVLGVEMGQGLSPLVETHLPEPDHRGALGGPTQQNVHLGLQLGCVVVFLVLDSLLVELRVAAQPRDLLLESHQFGLFPAQRLAEVLILLLEHAVLTEH